MLPQWRLIAMGQMAEVEADATHSPPPAAGGASVHMVTQAAHLSSGSLNQTVFFLFGKKSKDPKLFCFFFLYSWHVGY